MQGAQALDPSYLSMIIPARWFTAGRENQLGEFREKMLHNDSIEYLHDYPIANEVFRDVEIKGGVCYFLQNAE